MRGMVIDMNDQQLLTLAQLQGFLDGTAALDFSVAPEERYAFITRIENGADSHRIRQYIERWVSWLHGGLQGAVTENRFNQIWNYVNLKLSG